MASVPAVNRHSEIVVISRHAGGQLGEISFPYNLHISLAGDGHARRVSGSGRRISGEIFATHAGHLPLEIDIVLYRKSQTTALDWWLIGYESVISSCPASEWQSGATR